MGVCGCGSMWVWGSLFVGRNEMIKILYISAFASCIAFTVLACASVLSWPLLLGILAVSCVILACLLIVSLLKKNWTPWEKDRCAVIVCLAGIPPIMFILFV